MRASEIGILDFVGWDGFVGEGVMEGDEAGLYGRLVL